MNEYYIEFFNHHNFGDDLLVYCITRAFPDYIFHINGTKENLKGLININNLKIHYDNFFSKKLNGILRRIYRKKDFILNYRARNCAAVIYLGGSLFIEPKDSDIEEYYLNNIRRRVDKKKFFLIGANFGPYRTESFYRFFLSEFGKYDFISFRDKQTYAAFDSLNNIQYAPDIGFSISEWFGEIKKSEKRHILISVAGDTVVDNYLPYKNQLIDWARQYISKGFSIVLLAMCDEQGDLKACNEILKDIDDCSNASVVSYGNDLIEVINYTAASDYVIGTRFHSIVTSLALSVPVLPLIYSIKTSNMLENCGFDGIQIDINEISQYTFEEIDSNRINGNRLNTQQLAIDSKKHFSCIL